MKQHFYFKFVFLSLLMMVMGVGSTFAVDKWVKTAPAGLVDGDVVVIVDLYHDNYGLAMSNDKGTSSAPSAVKVTLNNYKSEITSTVADNLMWTLSISDDGYQFYATESTWMYCINNNNGLRVGDNSQYQYFSIKTVNVNNVDKIYLYNDNQGRYIGVYNDQDWRSYTTSPSNNNIKNTVTAFFKKVSGTDANLTSITLSGNYPTVFNVGDEFSHAGMKVMANYDDETSEDVTSSASFSGYNMNASGTQTVTVSYGGKTATYDITVNTVPVAGITLNQSEQTLHVGETLQLMATIQPENATNKEYSWSTSDESIATVDENGLVTAVAEGSASITATADGDETITATCNITVEALEGDWYSLVTTTGNLAEGDKVIIVNTGNNKAMSTTQNDNNRDAIDVTISDGKVFVPEDGGVQVFTLEGDDNGWYFNTGNGYIYAASSSKNWLKTETERDDNAKAKIEISNGATSVVFQGEYTRNVLQNNGIIFSCYGSASQGPVDIYKLDDGKPKPTISFAESVVEITYGDNYNKQAATVEGFSGNLVYTSSDESVVKFHGNNVIDVLGPGTVTITATAPATDTTSKSSASYTLKIYEPADATEGTTLALDEHFNDCESSRPDPENFGDKGWNGTNQFKSLPETCNWTVDGTASPAGNGCLKLGTGTSAGDATSPSFTLNGKAPLAFDIAPWTSSSDGSITGSKSVTVTLTNATFEDGSTTKTVGDPFTIGWNHFEYDVTGSGDVTINFHGGSQFFLDNVVVGGGAQPAHEINLTFSSAGYLTWVATADIDFSQTEGVTAYQITEATPKKITMVEVDKVPKGAAVMLKGSDTKTLKRTTEEVADLSDNKMKACTDGSVTGNGNGVTNTDVYVLGNGKSGLGFYMLKGTLQAGKGYLQVSEGTGNAKPNFISFEETTGVKTVVINKDSDGEVYNLQGIRVAHPQKGIYVKNGKKYVIK